MTSFYSCLELLYEYNPLIAKVESNKFECLADYIKSVRDNYRDLAQKYQCQHKSSVYRERASQITQLIQMLLKAEYNLKIDESDVANFKTDCIKTVEILRQTENEAITKAISGRNDMQINLNDGIIDQRQFDSALQRSFKVKLDSNEKLIAINTIEKILNVAAKYCVATTGPSTSTIRSL